VLKPLFKGLRVAPFVECPHCHALSECGTKQCLGCSADMNSKDDASVYIVMVNMGARYTPFVECPNCRKLLKIGVRRCPDCYEEIPEAYALASAVAVVTNTIACDVANSIRGYDSFAVLAVIGSVGLYVGDLYIWGSPRLFYGVLFWSIMPLMLTLLWLYRFGRFAIGDDEYLRSRRGLRRTLTLWLAISAAQIIAVAVWCL
jgi:hypothetical protein